MVIKGVADEFFKNYITNRIQTVRINQVKSAAHKVKIG